MYFAEFRIAQQLGQQPHEHHGRRNFAAFGAFVEFLEVRFRKWLQRSRAHLALRHVSAELLTPRLHVLDFGAIVSGTVKRRLMQFVVWNRNAEARAEHLQFVFVQLLLLVSDVLAFAGLAQSVALNRLREDDAGRTSVIEGSSISGVHLDRIVSAQPHSCQLIVGQVLDHLKQAGIAAEKVLAEVRSALDEILLILPVADFAKSTHKQAIAIVLNQAVPVGTPDALDHIPTCAAENRFQFLNDFAVAAHRPVEPLQVAVHHEDQIVELLAGGQGDRAQRFRLVHLAVAEKCPNLAAGRWFESTILEILDEARVVDRLNRAQTHRNGGELPEIRHQPWVRIRAQSAAHPSVRGGSSATSPSTYGLRESARE